MSTQSQSGRHNGAAFFHGFFVHSRAESTEERLKTDDEQMDLMVWENEM